MSTKSKETEAHDVQVNEIEALSAIFGNDCIIAPQGKGLGKSVHLTLVPHPGEKEDNHVSIRLYISLPPLYPFVIPSWNIDSTHGLRDEELTELKDLIRRTLKDAPLGVPMVFDLTQAVEAFLIEHNVEKVALYEEMMRRQKSETERTLSTSAQLATSADSDGSVWRPSPIREAPSLRRREFIISSSSSADETDTWAPASYWFDETSHSVTPSPSPIEPLVDKKKTRRGRMQQVDVTFRWQKTAKVGEGSTGTVWSGIERDTGKLLAIRSVAISLSLEKELRDDAIKEIRTELAEAQALPHRHLLHYLGCEFNEQEHTIYIFSDYVAGSLAAILAQIVSFEESVIRRYTKQILSALQCLHNADISHNNLRLSNVLLDNQSDVKLADYVAQDWLLFLRAPEKHANLRVALEAAKFPEYPKEEDFVALGCVVAEMATGKEWSPSRLPCSLDFPSDFSPEIRTFVAECVSGDATLDCSDLLAHAFLSEFTSRADSSRVPFTPPSSVGKMLDNSDDSFDDDSVSYSASSLSMSRDTLPRPPLPRYQMDFDELETIGAGGFGAVVKARNKLDGRVYAIKKIKFGRTDKRYLEKVLREVITFSRLHHQHVVRYYTAWIDHATENDEKAMRTARDSDFDSASSSASESLSDEEAEPGKVVEVLDEESDSDAESLGNGWFDDTSAQPLALSSSTVVTRDMAPLFEPPGDVDKKNGTESKQKLILYIQMEYCTSKTLRHVIDEGLPYDEDDIWRLFRQIVEGLNHVHSQGMIHRDLKPSNIFINRNGDVEIGDFGLATAGKGETKRKKRKHEQDPLMRTTSLTTGVGTPFYLAPEQAKRGVLYDYKVDIYSLGVIFSEMCIPFRTGAERRDVLVRLRQPVPEFPPNFAREHSTKCELCRWLLQEDPAKRPSTGEILSSDFLPPKLEEEILKEAIRSVMTQRNTSLFDHLLTRLFTLAPEPHLDYTYGAALAPLPDLYWREKVNSRVARIFKRHGAVAHDTTSLVPQSPLSISASAPSLLDASGLVVQLPSDLTLPFARWLAHSRTRHIRRYVMGKVYRKSAAGGQPRELFGCEFDIVASPPTPQYGHVYIAETLRCTCEVMDEFAAEIGAYHIRLNNTQFLDAVLRDMGKESEESVAKIIAVFSGGAATRKAWPEIRAELARLSPAPSPRTFEALSVVAQAFASGNVGNQLLKVEAHFKHNARASAALADLRSVLAYCKQFEVFLKIRVDLLMVYNYNYYEDFVFQVIGKHDGHEAVLAAGGKFSSLIARFAATQRAGTAPVPGSLASPLRRLEGISAAVPVAVGVNFALDRFVALSQAHAMQGKSDIMHVSETEVLIVAMGKPMLKERMELASMLWENDIRTEYTVELTGETYEEICEHCRLQGIPLLVLLKSRLYDRDRSVRVRIIASRQEVTLAEKDLVSFVIHARAQLQLPLEATRAAAKKDHAAPTSPLPVSVDVEILGASGHYSSKLKRRLAIKVQSALEDDVKALERLSVLPAVVVAAPLLLAKEVATKMDSLNKSDPLNPVVPRTSAKFQNNQPADKFRDKLSELKTYLASHKHIPLIAVYSSMDDEFFFVHNKKK